MLRNTVLGRDLVLKWWAVLSSGLVECHAWDQAAAQVRSTFLLVAGLSVAAILCFAVCGIAAWGRFVRGLSWTDMRKGHWEPPEEEGWRTGATASNMLPTARFESWQGNVR